MLAFGTGTALITHVFRLAGGAPTLAGSFSTAAFNVGAALGPWLGGLAIGAGFGFRSPLWVSALLMVLALATAAAALGRRPVRAPDPARDSAVHVRGQGSSDG